MGHYKYLEHVADVYISISGSSLEDAFETAALAMFDTMTDVDQIEPSITENFLIKAEDEIGLLHEWLHSLLLKFELEMKIFSKFNIKYIRKKEKNLFLKGMAVCEIFNPNKHSSKVDIKAVTYHHMSISRVNGNFELQFILDI